MTGVQTCALPISAQLGEHGRGDLTGVGAVVVDGHVLGAVLEGQRVGLDDRLHGADVREGRDDQDLALGVVVVGVGQRHRQPLDEVVGLEGAEIGRASCRERV